MSDAVMKTNLLLQTTSHSKWEELWTGHASRSEMKNFWDSEDVHSPQEYLVQVGRQVSSKDSLTQSQWKEFYDTLSLLCQWSLDQVHSWKFIANA